MKTEYQVKVTNSSYGGDSVAKLPDGRTVFIPFVIPGEEVIIRLTDEKKSFARAELVKVLTPALTRVTPRCKHFGVCGGCHYQHMDYVTQLKMKRSIFIDTLRRVGGIMDVDVPEMVPSPQTWNYRNHIQFHPMMDGKLGFQAGRSHQMIPIEECHLPEQTILDAWHQFQLEDIARLDRVSFRCGADEDIQVILESDSIELPELELDTPDSVIHLSPAGALVLAGSPQITIEVDGRSFQVSAGSFFQVNIHAAREMVRKILDWMPDLQDATLLDLYCGVGLFSAFLAPKVKRLTGVEVAESSCGDFAQNLDEYENVDLYQGLAEEVLQSLTQMPDVVIVDPPRAGLDAKVITSLVKAKPQDIIYVSCDPTTLARDLRKFIDSGYQVRDIRLVDMFPQTFHIESITHLQAA
jgi:23S rRNA (uracil1939-C5)-methyltransferase